MKIIGASLGECVHIQGVYNFLKLAEENGHQTHFLGPALDPDQLIERIKEEKPDAVALSYRLTSQTGEVLLKEFISRINAAGLTQPEFLFGGTSPVAEIARQSNFFVLVSDGDNKSEVISYLRQKKEPAKLTEVPPQKVTERISWKKPLPLLRTHFGLPTLEDTLRGIEQIAESELIDVISLGTDQDAQANFYHPEKQNPSAKGAGGVPVRTPQDFQKLFQATRRGNFPLMRTYAGTDDLIKLAEMYQETFGQAWSAIPIFWFNQMDRRGPHSLEESITEHLKLIEWNAQNNIPVEILEAHHWGMRWAHDSLVVASAYLGAEIAKKSGVQTYIHQYMFNIPPETSFSNDLAKMLAVKEMLARLEDNSFKIYHQTRSGLPSFPNNPEAARGQLASSTLLQLQLSPDIVHLVSYSEPHHAAAAKDVINSARIVNQVIQNCQNSPDMTYDPSVQQRKKELIREAEYLLSYLHENGDIKHPAYLSSLVISGLFDAPMLKNNPFARGKIRTAFFDGACYPLGDKNKIISEQERIQSTEQNNEDKKYQMGAK